MSTWHWLWCSALLLQDSDQWCAEKKKDVFILTVMEEMGSKGRSHNSLHTPMCLALFCVYLLNLRIYWSINLQQPWLKKTKLRRIFFKKWNVQERHCEIKYHNIFFTNLKTAFHSWNSKMGVGVYLPCMRI